MTQQVDEEVYEAEDESGDGLTPRAAALAAAAKLAEVSGRKIRIGAGFDNPKHRTLEVLYDGGAVRVVATLPNYRLLEAWVGGATAALEGNF